MLSADNEHWKEAYSFKLKKTEMRPCIYILNILEAIGIV